MKYSENEEQKNLLNQFLASNGVELSADVLAKLYAFADLVVETKEYGNLISEKDSQKFLSRHIADSLVPYMYIGKLVDPIAALQDDRFKVQDDTANFRVDILSKLKGKRWADMGAGAGCPSFPLAIVMPEVQFYAVEPRNKRVQFMNFVKDQLHLDNMTVVGKRFETSGLAYLDFVSCRALSTFENDWERAQPGLARGGQFVTLKSYNNIVHLENDPAVHIYKYALPQEEQEYALVTRGNE
ncbi:MAG: class I SAM-dependent methyltransferase, partial [Fibrobacter sp.]|nr:class I SAM-dependent methyltransferase [Fibrobacter sp.]